MGKVLETILGLVLTVSMYIGFKCLFSKEYRKEIKAMLKRKGE